jgi:hypothetical protein
MVGAVSLRRCAWSRMGMPTAAGTSGLTLIPSEAPTNSTDPGPTALAGEARSLRAVREVILPGIRLVHTRGMPASSKLSPRSLRTPQFAAIAETYFACCAAHSGPISTLSATPSMRCARDGSGGDDRHSWLGLAVRRLWPDCRPGLSKTNLDRLPPAPSDDGQPVCLRAIPLRAIGALLKRISVKAQNC